MKTINLSIVMPAYNEESSIETVIDEHLEVASRLPRSVTDWEIICLDDASVDRTPALLDELSRRTSRLRILTHATNRGIFASATDLYRAATGSYIYVTACDGQWPAGNLLLMLREIEAGADYVVGVRTNRRRVYSLQRRFISYMFNLLPRLCFGVETGDAGSVKLGRREIFQLPNLSRSPFAEAERIVRAQRAGYRVALLPIQFSPRLSGKATGAKFNNVVASARDCLKLALSKP